MTIGSSLLVIAAGAILKWAVTARIAVSTCRTWE